MNVTAELVRSWMAKAQDPLWFCADTLGDRLWKKQAEALVALRDHKRVAVASGHACGKTFVASRAVAWFLLSHPGARVFTTAPTHHQVVDNLWHEIRRMHGRSRRVLGGELLPQQPRWRLPGAPGWEAVGFSTTDADAFQGRHGAHVLVVFDEAQGVADTIWQGAESLMTAPGARWLAIGNPTHSSGPFFDAFHGGQGWHTIRVSCLEHPNLTAEQAGNPPPIPGAVSWAWVRDQAARWGEDSSYYRSHVLGEFPLEGDDNLVTLSMLERAAERNPPSNADGVHLGLDVARYGSDQNVAVRLENRRVTTWTAWGGVDLIETAGRTRHLAEKWGVPPENVHVDGEGLGGGAVDRLREAGILAEDVKFGAGPVGDWTGLVGEIGFKNRRAELYWALRTLLSRNELQIPRDFSACWGELSVMRYHFDPNGRIQIEAKDRIRERTGRSPDHADAVAIALSRANSGGLGFMVI